MIKNKKNNILLLIFLFFLFTSSSFTENYVKKNTIKLEKGAKIIVSKNVYSRIEGYLNGEFYSKNLNKKLKQVSGIYFALSKDGNSSSISFCDADHFNLCAEQLLAYQTLKKCEKYSQIKCFLIFRGKVFLPTKDKNIDIKKNFVLSGNKNVGYHYDIYGKNLEEFFDTPHD